MRGKCAVCAEKDRTIDVLAEQIEWLRTQLGSPSMRPVVNPTKQQPITVGVEPFMSEEEEDIRHLVEAGAIDKENLPEVLDALGFINTEIDFS